VSLADCAIGRIDVAKAPTTQKDFGQGVLSGVDMAMRHYVSAKLRKAHR
jgi:hypothetical protein